MVDYEAGRTCKKCGELLRVDEFRFKNRRKDGKHLICFDCEPQETFASSVVVDELRVADEKEAKKKVSDYATGAIREGYKVVGDVEAVQDHFLMLASTCEDIALQLSHMRVKGKENSYIIKDAGEAAKKIREAIKILS